MSKVGLAFLKLKEEPVEHSSLKEQSEHDSIIDPMESDRRFET